MERMPILRDDDQESILAAAGPVLPVLLREAIDHGFFLYGRSRALDPDAHADYSLAARANILYDRIAAVVRGLVDVSGLPDLSWVIGRNGRATEVRLHPYLNIRVKREKSNRGGRTASVGTHRQLSIKAPKTILTAGQMVLPFCGEQCCASPGERIWLTATFDLDDFEETISCASIGVEHARRFLWKQPLVAPAPDVIATLNAPLAERIGVQRHLRSA